MENTPKELKITTPQAIIVAAVIIMLGILLSRPHAAPTSSTTVKTLSEQVGVSKEQLNACIKSTDLDALSKKITTSVDNAMSDLPKSQRGTPYTVVIGKNGVKTDIRGADSYENVKKVVDAALVGTVAVPYTGAIDAVTADDHFLGNPTATVTLIEYSDFECPFCKRFHPIMKRIVEESNGSVRWVYRHYPIHQHSFEKLLAADCVAKIAGPDAFWKYTDLLFGLLKTGDESVSEQL